MKTAESPTRSGDRSRNAGVAIAFPAGEIDLDQDEEWFVARVDGEWEEMRLHDYDRIFSVPRLYEHLVYEVLKCDSPRTIRRLLERALRQSGADPRELRVLDVGAGNGMVGEELSTAGAGTVVGVDIIQAAAEATERDRPGVYDDYFVTDLTRLSKRERETLAHKRFNCMVCVAALGFGDIPTDAFLSAFDLVEPGGWIAFNIKEEFLSSGDGSGFARLIRGMIGDGLFEVCERERYVHRLGISGDPIHYVGIVGRKCCKS